MATDSVARAIALAAKANSGKPGPAGPKGDDGLAATIQVGTVTTGAAGTNAEVTNVGTENAAIFNFTIPKGDTGEAGSGGLSTIVAGTGTSSIVMNHDDTNTNVASGNYSTALGYGTKAAGNGALAAGYSNTPGNIQALKKGSMAFGKIAGNASSTIKALQEGSIVIGSVKNGTMSNNGENAFIIGSVNSETYGSNIGMFIAPGATYDHYCQGCLAGGAVSQDGQIAIGDNFGGGLGSIAYGAAIGSDRPTGNPRGFIIADRRGCFALGFSRSSTIQDKSYIQAKEDGAFALGCSQNGNITSSNYGAIAAGYSEKLTPITSSGIGSIAMGTGTSAKATGSISIGFSTDSGVENQTALGKYNIAQTSADETKYGLIFGNGTADARANAFTLDWTGNATFAGTVTSASGADYAEYFEWKDGNVNSEDRVGYIVTLDGDKIVKAKAGDDILGIISGCATVIGDNAEWNWQGRFERDEFGRIIYDQVEQFIDTPDPNWEPNPEKPDEEVPMIKKSLGYFPVPRENAAYDPTKEYANRSNRPEWDTVGMMGKLYVRDDGTAAINDYVTVSATTDGVATKAEGRTSMRVMERVNDHVIRVCFK